MARIVEPVVPLLRTIEQYGLTLKQWREFLHSQGGACGVCGNLPPSGRLFIDHEHVRGWKKMPPEERRKYVRGLACYRCNRFILNNRITADILRLAAKYLEHYEWNKQNGGFPWAR